MLLPTGSLIGAEATADGSTVFSAIRLPSAPLRQRAGVAAFLTILKHVRSLSDVCKARRPEQDLSAVAERSRSDPAAKCQMSSLKIVTVTIVPVALIKPPSSPHNN